MSKLHRQSTVRHSARNAIISKCCQNQVYPYIHILTFINAYLSFDMFCFIPSPPLLKSLIQWEEWAFCPDSFLKPWTSKVSTSCHFWTGPIFLFRNKLFLPQHTSFFCPVCVFTMFLSDWLCSATSCVYMQVIGQNTIDSSASVSSLGLGCNDWPHIVHYRLRCTYFI